MTKDIREAIELAYTNSPSKFQEEIAAIFEEKAAIVLTNLYPVVMNNLTEDGEFDEEPTMDESVINELINLPKRPNSVAGHKEAQAFHETLGNKAQADYHRLKAHHETQARRHYDKFLAAHKSGDKKAMVVHAREAENHINAHKELKPPKMQGKVPAKPHGSEGKSIGSHVVHAAKKAFSVFRKKFDSAKPEKPSADRDYLGRKDPVGPKMKYRDEPKKETPKASSTPEKSGWKKPTIKSRVTKKVVKKAPEAPKVEKKVDAPKAEAPKAAPAPKKVATPKPKKTEAPKVEPKVEPKKVEAPKAAPKAPETKKVDAPKEAPKKAVNPVHQAMARAIAALRE